jgi:hypothetical protein
MSILGTGIGGNVSRISYRQPCGKSSAFKRSIEEKMIF